MAEGDNKIDTHLVRGQAFKFMPIPMDERHAEWFDAGLVSFAVETRVLGEAQDGMAFGGGSIHLFAGDRSRELVRFDCFDSEPHYHYLDHRAHVNTVWSYDPAVNGPMPRWVLTALRDNLPSMLRAAGEGELAAQVEARGFDTSVLAKLEQALAAAHERSLHDPSLAAAGVEWVNQWRANNPDLAIGNA
jgi:hypothetical protein